MRPPHACVCVVLPVRRRARPQGVHGLRSLLCAERRPRTTVARHRRLTTRAVQLTDTDRGARQQPRVSRQGGHAPSSRSWSQASACGTPVRKGGGTRPENSVAHAKSEIWLGLAWLGLAHAIFGSYEGRRTPESGTRELSKGAWMASRSEKTVQSSEKKSALLIVGGRF